MHKKAGRNFDNMILIKEYDSKTIAYAAENSIIRFNGLFNLGLENSKHQDDVHRYELNFYKKVTD